LSNIKDRTSAGGGRSSPRRVALYLAAKGPLDRARKTVSAHSGHDRRQEPSAAMEASIHEQSRQEPSLACRLRLGSRINLYPVERQWL
jgi:hypothetical protein